LARLRELLSRAAAGQPQVVLLGGDAGVGKTRLVERLEATATRQGVRVLGGGCVPLGEEGLPFAPVTEALRGLADQLDPAELQAVAGPARQELARLLPELAWSADAATNGGAMPVLLLLLILVASIVWPCGFRCVVPGFVTAAAIT
jgi:predicted ATPase